MVFCHEQLEYYTAAEHAPGLDFGRMFDAGDGRHIRAAGSPHMADLTVQRVSQLEQLPIRPGHLIRVFLRPVDTPWPEVKGGGLVVFPSISLSFPV